MSDTAEDWAAYKKDQRRRREKRIPGRSEQISALAAEGYQVIKKTDYHFRINGVLDLYPTHNRWHHIKTGERGGAQNLAEFVRQTLKPCV